MEIKAKHFKLIYFLLFLCFSSFSSYSQNVGISPQGSGNPNSNAGLDINYTNKGLLIPRIALASTSSASPLSAHVAGMIVYNTVSAAGLTPGLYYNNGAKWNLVFQKLLLREGCSTGMVLPGKPFHQLSLGLN